MTTLADIHEQLVHCYLPPTEHPESTEEIWEAWIADLLEEFVQHTISDGVTSARLCERLGMACNPTLNLGRTLYAALENEGWLHPTYYSWSYDEGLRLMPHAEFAEALRFEAKRRAA